MLFSGVLQNAPQRGIASPGLEVLRTRMALLTHLTSLSGSGRLPC
jgi:hypothetical protein